MTLGPALSGQFLDAESSAKAERLQAEVLETLKSILDRMPAVDQPV
jgi:hypothetical protein